MTTRIHPLPPILANQIAAGEVIERPASVVKELLENSLDAGARKIEITIAAGGTRLIKISDDGSGIHPDDLSLAITSHATSKLTQLEDLFAITSLGFRGEALASISSVARCQLISKIASQDTAYKLTVAAREFAPQVEAAAHPQGTTVIVQDLFFNTPVRRKFLYSEKTEFSHIENLVKRVVLSRFNIAFKLTHDEKVILQVPAAINQQGKISRVSKLFGAAFLAQAIYLDVAHNGVRLWGWLGLPSFMRSQNDLQYCYLNGRMVRDKLINHALRQAYETKLYPGRQAAYLLYCELDPRQVDVNVHPTKHEVRFREARQIHDFLVSQVTQAISERSNSSNIVSEAIAPIYARVETKKSPSVATILAWLPAHYWLVEYAEQQLICDYQQLYQDLTVQRLQQALAQGSISHRPLLVPLKFNLIPTQLNLLTQYFEDLAQLGLHLSQLDQHTLMVREFPVITPYLDFQQLINQLAEKSQLTLAQLIMLIAQANHAGKHLTAAETGLILEFLQQKQLKLDKHCVKIMTAKAWAGLMES